VNILKEFDIHSKHSPFSKLTSFMLELQDPFY